MGSLGPIMLQRYLWLLKLDQAGVGGKPALLVDLHRPLDLQTKRGGRWMPHSWSVRGGDRIL